MEGRKEKMLLPHVQLPHWYLLRMLHQFYYKVLADEQNSRRVVRQARRLAGKFRRMAPAGMGFVPGDMETHNYGGSHGPSFFARRAAAEKKNFFAEAAYSRTVSAFWWSLISRKRGPGF